MVRRRLERLANREEVMREILSGTTPSQNVLACLADVLTTNHTHWGREFAHFGVLGDYLARCRQPRVRIWCAASSSGEEPYSLWMTAKDSPVSERFSLLATDISAPALALARRGEYDKSDISQLPDSWQKRYFDARPNNRVAMVAEARESVLFRRLNLMTVPLPFKNKIDVIFVRNVVIYFEGDVRRQVVQRLVDQLRPGGLLCIGLAETLPKGVEGLSRCAASAYRKE